MKSNGKFAKNGVSNSRYDNFDSNIPDTEDEKEMADRVTDLNDVTRYGNKSLFGNVRFTESVNQRIDDYKRTSNYQKLIEEELLKDDMEVPVMPESIINPKQEIEIKSKEDIGGGKAKVMEGEDGDGDGDSEDEDVAQKRHLTMIQKNKDTNLTLDNNLTIMELANDLHFESNSEAYDSEKNKNNPIFNNDQENHVEEIPLDEDVEAEKEENDVTNLVQDEMEMEGEHVFKKREKDSVKFEEVEDEILDLAELQNETIINQENEFDKQQALENEEIEKSEKLLNETDQREEIDNKENLQKKDIGSQKILNDPQEKVESQGPKSKRNKWYPRRITSKSSTRSRPFSTATWKSSKS